MQRTTVAFIVILMAGILFFSCKKNNDDNPAPNAKAVKYEITGNFSGKLTILYNDNVNGNTVLENVTLPWTKEINYATNVMAIGIGAQSDVAGTAGQTATMKIYSGGNIVKSSNGTANASGSISLPALVHTF